ncbi:hypothetical protein J437_LFUL000585 [Ladona fulva]|uniref:Uncharacterized protein n=1 Tax=Ladona fulva TaxID=123851 RepID=A0A8K0NZN2_LADFU|nr:hypothetical protein J437_LFUL000585 [Ladona fulva]
MSQSDDTKGSKIAAAENLTGAKDGRKYSKINVKLSEEEKIKEWLELTDEERKARINRILDNLKDIPQNNPRVATPRLKTVEKPRAQHFMISFSNSTATASLIPSIENFKNVNPSTKIMAEKVSGAPSSAPSYSSSSTLYTNPSGNIVSNPSGSSNIKSSGNDNINPSGKSGTNPSGSTDANPFESQNTNPSGSSNTNSSGSSNTDPPGNSNINPTVSLYTNPSGSSNTDPSGCSNIKPSGSSNTDPSGSGNIKPSGSSNTDPSGSSDINSSVSLSANPSGSSVANLSESLNTNPSGSSDINSSVSLSANPSGSTDANPSGSTDANPSGSTDANPSGEVLMQILLEVVARILLEIVSQILLEVVTPILLKVVTQILLEVIPQVPLKIVLERLPEYIQWHLLKSSRIYLHNAVLRLVHGKSVGKLMCQQPSSKTGPSKVTATISAPSAQKSNDSIPFPTTEPSCLVAISQAPCVQNFQILQPLGKNSSNIMSVVPVNQQIIPQIGLQVSPQVAIEQIFLGKEGETVKNTKNVKESFCRRNEGSHKKTSSTSMNAGPELFKEIFGVDADCTTASSTSISEQPVELFKHIQNRSTLSNACMEKGNISGRSVTSVSKKVKANLKYIRSDNFEANAKKAKNCQKVNLETVSGGSSHKNTMPSTSAGSTNDGLRQLVERPMKVYSGKSALQKRVMHSAPELSENKRKQIFRPSEVIDLTNEGSDDKHNPSNVEGNKTGNPNLIEIKDPVSGKSFLILQEKFKNVEIQENKSMVHTPKGNKHSIPSNPASKTKEGNKLKQHMKKNVMEKLPLRTIIPKMSPVCVVQGNTIQMPKLQKVPTPNILLRKNVSNRTPKPVTLVMLPSEVLASTSGIEKQSGVSLMPIQLSGNQLPVPVAFHKSDNVSLKIIQQPVPVSIHKTNEGASLKIIQQPGPVSILKTNEGPALTAVASQKNDEGASAKDSSKIAISSNGGRKKLRKDLGKIRPAALLTEDLGELKSNALLNQPVVVLDRLSVKMDEGHCVYMKGDKGKAS